MKTSRSCFCSLASALACLLSLAFSNRASAQADIPPGVWYVYNSNDNGYFGSIADIESTYASVFGWTNYPNLTWEVQIRYQDDYDVIILAGAVYGSGTNLNSAGGFTAEASLQTAYNDPIFENIPGAPQPPPPPTADTYKTDGAPSLGSGNPGVSEPISVATGNMYDSVTDFETVGINPLAFTRYYNSLTDTNTKAIMLGRNWRSTFDRFLNIAISNNLPVSITAEQADGQELPFTPQGSVWNSDSDVGARLGQTATGWVLTNMDDSVETYDTGNSGTAHLLSIQSRNGYTQTMNYGASNVLLSVTDSFSRSLQFSYQGTLLQTVTCPDGLVLTYGFNSSGVNPGVTDRLASVSYSTVPQTGRSYRYENSAFPFALTSLIDENGDVYTSWAYDSHGRATSSQFGGGAGKTTVTYNDTDGSRVVTGPLGVQTLYKFASLQGVPKVTEMDRAASATFAGATNIQGYDANGYVGGATDWNGNASGFQNDVSGQPERIEQAIGRPDDRVTTVQYHTTFHLPIRIVGPLKIVDLVYDGSGNLLSRTVTDKSANGESPRTWTFTYTNFGLVLTASGPRTDIGTTTNFSYDANGFVNGITNPLGQTIRLVNNNRGLPLAVTDPNGVLTTFAYDVRGRLLSRVVHAPSGNATNLFTYDHVGQTKSITRPDGSVLSYQYDTAHRLTSVSNILGETINYALDVAGNITNTTVREAGGSIVKSQSQVFDQLGRLIKQIGASGQTNSFAYDNNGNAVFTQDGLGNITTKTFNPFDYPVTSTDPLTNSTVLAYDTQNTLASVTDPRGLMTSYNNDGFGDIVQATSPDTRLTGYQFDYAGNCIVESDYRGVNINRTFDALGRETAENYHSSVTPDQNNFYGYDATNNGNCGAGRLTSYSDITGNTAFVYNERGDMITMNRVIAGVPYSLFYTYDLADNTTGITYPSGHIFRYTRDSQQRIASVTYLPSATNAPEILATNIAYAAFGPLTGFTYGNGLSRMQGYDLDYRLTNIVTRSMTANVQNLALTYDTANNIIAIADNLNTTRNQLFGYDADYRLTQATGIYGAESFIYDSDGNRVAEVASGVTNDYAYSPIANYLTSVTSSTNTHQFAYTSVGNTASDTPDSGKAYAYTYDNRNRLKTVSVDGTLAATYFYNAPGERLAKVVGTAVTHFLYDLQHHLIAESDGYTGAMIREYVWLDDMPLAQIEADGTVYFIHPDHLNTPQKMTDATQAIVWDRQQKPFGETVSVTAGGSSASPATFSSLGFDGNHHFGFAVNGIAGNSYVVEAAASVTTGTWMSVATNVVPFTFTDTNAASATARFYRAVPVPQTVGPSSVTQNLRFPGQYFDAESGLHYNTMRDYDPLSGRYIQADPTGLTGGNNVFQYCYDDPINFIDEDGLSPYYWWDLILDPTEHDNRNRLNDPPASERDAKRIGWIAQPDWKSKYHRQGAPGNQRNMKYLSPDGHGEAVYDACGHLVTDDLNEGTYNYGVNPLDHFFWDMLPYYFWGNSPRDPNGWLNNYNAN